MKIIISFLAVVLLSSCAISKGGEASYRNFYKKYKKTEGIVSFKIPMGLARIFVDNDDKEAKEFLKKADDVSFFIAEEKNNILFSELKNYLPIDVYKDIMVIRDGASTITFKVKDTDNTIEEIIMTVQETDSFVVMCVTGDFDLEDAKAFTKSVDIKEVINTKD